MTRTATKTRRPAKFLLLGLSLALLLGVSLSAQGTAVDPRGDPSSEQEKSEQDKSAKTAEQKKAARAKDDAFLSPDPRGAGRPRLTGEGFLGSLAMGDAWVRLGGYMDIEYRDIEDKNRRLRFHRLVPLIEGQVSERVRFQTELEIEDGDVLDIEFAHIDYQLHERLDFRAGLILLPLGKLNLIHDSPIQELTDRPLMHRKVIPTTLRDVGFGVHGNLSLDEDGGFFEELNFEIYLISGFRGQDSNSKFLINRTDGLRKARSNGKIEGFSEYEDNNNNLAWNGRVSIASPGFELGLSGYHGSYDLDGELDLTMGVVDLEFSPAAISGLEDTVFADWRFLAEGALGNVERDGAARAAGVPGSVDGWYVQWGWKIGAPKFMTDGEDPLVEGNGGFTLLLRHGRVDLDGASFERTVVGFNFRPDSAKTVFKFEYQWNREGGLATGVSNDGFVASVATYF